MKRKVNLFIVCMLCCFAFGCSGLALLPDSYVNQMGAESYADQKKQLPISQDQVKSEIVHRVANRLIEKCKELHPEQVEGFNWEVNLFQDDKTPNAYALPGGLIGIYTGILPICETEAGLAAVMGHEIGHALLRHGNKRVSTQLAANGVVLVAGAAMSVTDTFASNKEVVMGALGAGAQYGVILPFSRGNESEADAFGLEIMAASGYNPEAAPKIWHNMKKLGGEVPEYTSTHPSHDTRIADLEAGMAKALEVYNRAPVKYGMGDRFTSQQ